ncbi:hypothetical protein, partial [Palleronia rufa]
MRAALDGMTAENRAAP